MLTSSSKLNIPLPRALPGVRHIQFQRLPRARHLVELREHFGPGYRIYVTPVGNTLVIALGGGGKSSQRADIARAAKLAQQAQE